LNQFYNKDKLKKLWFQGSNRQIITHNENDNTFTTSKFINNKIHCDDSPAIITIINNNMLHRTINIYSINGKYHRLDGPAFKRYDKYQMTTQLLLIKNIGLMIIHTPKKNIRIK
jgi:hypothetical protein